MGLQVPYRVRAQATAQSNIRADAPSSGTDFPCAGPAKGVPDNRRASDAGSCAYVYRDSSQAPGSFRDRVSEREECDRYCPAVRQGTEFLVVGYFEFKVAHYRIFRASIYGPAATQ